MAGPGGADGAEIPAAALPITFDSKLEPGEYLRLTLLLVLRHPVAIAAMLSGPIVWVFGIGGGDAALRAAGQSLWLFVVLVPLSGLLAGMYGAYRPGAAELYVPVTWRFDDDGVVVDQQGESARAPWSDFVRWREIGACYLLHTDRARYVVIPVRCVPEGLRVPFEELLTARLGAPGR